MPDSKLTVMISSTARDLPEHRKQAIAACERMGMFPLPMENLPPKNADAIDVSLEMVDKADIYVGIFASRYGFVPKDPRNPNEISVTEMEYNRAVERGIPRLIFMMHEDHLLKSADVETGTGAEKLKKFKDRVGLERVAGFFKNPDDLRALMIHALSEYRQYDPAILHSLVALDVPEAPTPYIAHPYTLLQTSQLVGRQKELNLLTDWVAKPDTEVYKAHILNVVAIGGMGKSALTWKWFNDIAPEEMKPLAGRMWWSFYESGAYFENFVISALAYVSKTPREEVQKMLVSEQEEKLLRLLDEQPFLLVLDGLERILMAYTRMDAAYLVDDELDERTANRVANAYGLPESAGKAFIGQHQLRKTADPRAGKFLRRLATGKQSRILISTRLYPSELQTVTGNSIPGSVAVFLIGLQDDDALALWRAMGVSGRRDTLLPMFQRFENYPLLIQVLAGVVANYKRAPGDFGEWRKANPNFNPFQNLTVVQVMSHVLEWAMKGLDENSLKALQTIAAFRMPASYDTLAAVLIDKPVAQKTMDDNSGDGFTFDEDSDETIRAVPEPTLRSPKPFTTETELDVVLTDLEDRGLIGWDKVANRYDLHPIVRGVTWNGLKADDRRGVYENLQIHFEAIPSIDEDKVESLEDLAPTIELYHTLIGLERYDDAFSILRDRFVQAMFFRLARSRQLAEAVERLFPDGIDRPPRLEYRWDQARALNTLGLAYKSSGQPGRAVPLYRLHNDLHERDPDGDLSSGLINLSDALRLLGGLREAAHTARRALVISRKLIDRFDEAISLRCLGKVLAVRGEGMMEGLRPIPAAGENPAENALRRSLWLFLARSQTQSEGVNNAYLAQAALWRGDAAAALPLAERAWGLADNRGYERDFIRAARLQGEVALGLDNFMAADERLHHALTRARTMNWVEEELPALIALAELARRQGEMDKARERLDEVWEDAERGPYPLFYADALNVLAQIERDAGNTQAAIEVATKAYEKAWCDGISEDGETCYAYWWGLQKAKAHLEALGTPIPKLTPFDESKYEPMPEVKINPHDEYWVDEPD